MARIPIVMPKLGYDMTSGRIGTWTKQEGDTIARGDIIAEIETDKASVEIESTAGGVLVEIVHGVGTELDVGEVIAYLESEPKT